MLIQLSLLIVICYGLEFDKSKTYQYNNFSLLGLEYIEELEIDQSLLDVYQEYQITDDSEYQKEINEELIQKYQIIAENGFEKFRDYFYIKYIDNQNGFGLFTKYFIKSKSVLGFLGGIVAYKPQIETVMWPYNSDMNTNQDLHILFNKKGNFLNFFNFSLNFNCDDIIFPYKNKWQIMFVTNQDIYPDQQILLSYNNDQNTISQNSYLSNVQEQKYENVLQGKVKYIQAKDFELLGLSYLEESRVDLEVKYLLQAHDLEKDQYYIDNKQNIQELIKKNEQFFNQVNNLDEILYVKFVDEQIGYGCFVKSLIKQDQLIAEYAGVISVQKGNTDYSWEYKSNFKQQKVNLFINGLKEGNFLRFVNDYEQPNVKAVFLPYKNTWRVYYQALREIKVGEELAISYGEKYWIKRDKQIKDSNIDPQIKVDKDVLKVEQTSTEQKNLYKIDKLGDLDVIRNSDFSKIGLVHLKKIRFEYPHIKRIVEQNNIFQDKEYLDYIEENDQNIMRYTDQINELGDMDEKIEARYISPEIGYGVFSKKNIPQGRIIAEYTGVLRVATNDATYSWRYSSEFKKLKNNLVIDSIKEGNLLRFVNDYKYHNVEVLIMPHENMWKVFYLAKENIKIDEELSISYGRSYWNKRIQLNNQDQTQNYETVYEGDKKKYKYSQLGEKMKIVQNKDFDKLGLTYLKNSQFDNNIKTLLENHDPTQDERYIDYKDEIEDFIQEQKAYLDNPIDMDDQLYAKWITDDIGYGCFAKKYIYFGDIVGEYTGLITDKSEDYTYCWTYKTDFEQYKDGFCIDSKYRGNLLRFVNDLPDHNCEPMYITYNGYWRLYYVATRDIEVDEQISISYGESYWKNRIRLDSENKVIINDEL